MNAEITVKLAQLDALLARRGLNALLLQSVANFAWLTGGAASYVNIAEHVSVAALLITPTGRYLITNNIEAPRLRAEEQLETQGWEFVVSAWFETVAEIQRRAANLRIGCDGLTPGYEDVSADLTPLRLNLTPEEQNRFRGLACECTDAMNDTIQQVQPGQSEFEIAAILGAESQRRGVQPIVNLIATDERAYHFRHPLPTGKLLDKYAMLVLCGRQHGLVCSITRLVHFGVMPADLRRKAQAVAEIDAAMIAATRPGATLGEIFEQVKTQYTRLGFENEWQLHHQGGPTGYQPREVVAAPSENTIVAAGQAYAWNPSINGTKSEDTILITAGGYEILTEIQDWPLIEVELAGVTINRPATLEIV